MLTGFPQKVPADVNHDLLIGRLDAIVKIKVGDIGADHDQVVFLEGRRMPANVAISIRPINEDDLEFGMKMPVEQVTEIRIYGQAKGSSWLREYVLQFGFHDLKLNIICIIFILIGSKYQYSSNNHHYRSGVA